MFAISRRFWSQMESEIQEYVEACIVRNIKVILIAFCQESPQMLCVKFRANQLAEMDVAYITKFSTIQ